ncbi:hypothetical protein E1B28_001971 [Marasmius oreades]|uniref:DUF6534 domain-containing protein n=1 Tax=Marasmius oreades TaxID=181124 RepID=A0A9P7V4G9_9AGAR|nr:uncharacterized protein E1B28_001971 [Marasmius oreades]KAG7100194.1 hypothetical protein E1B28_001971 [Marasmius oreades]
MRFNLIFLGLHFIIGKLYTNSLLASLNTRKELRKMGPRISPWSDMSLPMLSFYDLPAPVPPRNHLLNPQVEVSYTSNNRSSMYKSRTLPLEVNVRQVVERTSEDLVRDDDLMILPRRAPTVLRWQQRRRPSDL